MYAVCQVTSQRTRNWLKIPEVSVSGVHRVFIELRFTMRQCGRFPDPSQIWRCKESIKLFSYTNNGQSSKVAETEKGATDFGHYKALDVIAADETFTDVTNPDVPVNVETRSVVVTSSSGVSFAVLDEGSCVMLLSVKIYHRICAQLTANLAIFADTPTSEVEGGIVTRDGVCVPNASIEPTEGTPTFYCKADGDWYLLKGSCSCNEGFEKDRDKRFCAPVTGKLTSVHLSQVN